MQVNGVWFGNTRLPSRSSPSAFVRDVFSFKDRGTDRDKELARSSWMAHCLYQSWSSLGHIIHWDYPTLRDGRKDGLIPQTGWIGTQGTDNQNVSLFMEPGSGFVNHQLRSGAERLKEPHVRGVTMSCLADQ